LIGESGSGKSVTLRSLLRLHAEKTTRITGDIRVGDQSVLKLSPSDLSRYRGRVASMIFQEPLLALDPVYSLGQQITETIRRHENVTAQVAQQRALALFERVRIPSPERRLQAYPHEMSGGMRQRAMIALALACKPQLLLADEPTTALDATVQIQILLLLRELQKDLGLALLFIAHDLAVVRHISQRVMVMYLGRTMEIASREALYSAARHPYSRALLSAIPILDPEIERNRSRQLLAGDLPSPLNPPSGCVFRTRCPIAQDQCARHVPPVQTDADGHSHACLVP